MKTILACAAAVALFGSCLSGVKGDRGATDCVENTDCGGGVDGQRCSRGDCVFPPCDIDADCDVYGFGLVCDSRECRRSCVVGGYGCGGGMTCVDGFCELEESGTLTSGFPSPLGPGAAGGGGEGPGGPTPDDGYDYYEGN